MDSQSGKPCSEQSATAASACSRAGRGSQDRYYESAVDTIFLLTDGTPTTNDGQPDSTARIFSATRAWNPQGHVVIHTIAIGRDLNASFLRQIADENGGRCVED